MPIDKNKLERFKALDRCFSDQTRYYFFDDLKSACGRAMMDAGCKVWEISRSTLYTDLSEFAANWPEAELIERKFSYYKGKRFYRYKDPKFSVWKQVLDSSQLAQLQSILLMLRQFQDFPQSDEIEDIIEKFESLYGFEMDNAEGIISFESNENIEAMAWMGQLFSYISAKTVLKITYQPFGQEERTFTFHPHFLKQYNRRWFLIGLTINETGRRSRTVLALDRLKSALPTEGEYIPSNKTLEELFEDQIGATLVKDETRTIRLKFTPLRYNYVDTKPLHPSQRSSVEDRANNIVTITVKPNRELYQTLLSFGPDVEVLEPTEVREKLIEKIKMMQDIYESPEPLD